MADIINFRGVTLHDIDATEMLIESAKRKPKNAILVTWDEGDDSFTYASSVADIRLATYAAQKFIHEAMTGNFNY
jgi:hypothetical protein